ncbi:hypothetical protein SAMD00019534_080160 [Acytostelium subglobosum LB1]|uniref:hypothetical protein n=1 Tax=Acytostelium subglobosum LB1 TaxID=1410327 RepID=UPI000644C0B9|nr:hypothetical protein SAMD00019534_109760 [Acytostelium subglobosum LB1]XP_012752510.1 hypothetical protein SAMD00019534_080160 [Acytostelium subglobosum LB1]GAM24841.1 hypothetical protein SAMD00019534_080160 [Acytostelium subglobosum LB1]GAM27800.1 hypothetical protein SAMD00019534_109760 [Acytostelium subglobosum LB1]|eukprot:XP_012749459.1 hypothetical protein SAMD00019534_109760 [Acytostelium subglobosum LB1]
MTILATLKNMNPSASLAKSGASFSGSSASGASQGSSQSACWNPCFPGIHIDANVDIDINLGRCNLLDAHISANINI